MKPHALKAGLAGPILSLLQDSFDIIALEQFSLDAANAGQSFGPSCGPCQNARPNFWYSYVLSNCLSGKVSIKAQHALLFWNICAIKAFLNDIWWSSALYEVNGKMVWSYRLALH